ncbi:MAG: E3 ubiquitin-protein ligase nedd4, partial [Paramarteilia canceri]
TNEGSKSNHSHHSNETEQHSKTVKSFKQATSINNTSVTSNTTIERKKLPKSRTVEYSSSQDEKTLGEYYKKNHLFDPLTEKLKQAKVVESKDLGGNIDSMLDNNDMLVFAGEPLIEPTEEDLGKLPNNYVIGKKFGQKVFINTTTKEQTYLDPRIWALATKDTSKNLYDDQILERLNKYLKHKQYAYLETIGNTYELVVKRSKMYQDAQKLLKIEPHIFVQKRLNVTFFNERAIDLNGVKREFISHISQTLFDPGYGVFQFQYSGIGNTKAKNYEVTINKFALNWCGKQDLKLSAIIFCLSFLYNCPLSTFLSVQFIKAVFGHPLKLSDLKNDDKELYKSLKYLLQCEDPEDLCLNFSHSDHDIDGNMVDVDLIENGSEIMVDVDNRKEYVRTLLKYRYIKSLGEPLTIFQSEVSSILGSLKDVKNALTAEDIRHIVCGEQTVDLEDMRANTQYANQLHADHITVHHFWHFMAILSGLQKKAVLHFALSSFKAPVGGFKNLIAIDGKHMAFTIVGLNNKNDLISSSTCFHRLNIPIVTEYDTLKKMLIMAIDNSRGFGGID